MNGLLSRSQLGGGIYMIVFEIRQFFHVMCISDEISVIVLSVSDYFHLMMIKRGETVCRNEREVCDGNICIILRRILLRLGQSALDDPVEILVLKRLVMDPCSHLYFFPVWNEIQMPFHMEGGESALFHKRKEIVPVEGKGKYFLYAFVQ